MESILFYSGLLLSRQVYSGLSYCMALHCCCVVLQCTAWYVLV